MKLKFATFVFFFILFLFSSSLIINKVYAVSCSPTAGGNMTVSSSCTFSNSSDGVDSGSGTTNIAILTIANGQTLTVQANQKVGFGTIANSGTIIVNTTAELLKLPIWMIDADGDGYPATTIQYVQANAPTNGKRRNTMLSLTQTDCNDSAYSATNSCCAVSTSCGSCSVSCGTGTQSCTTTNADCSTTNFNQSCNAGSCSAGYTCSAGTCVCAPGATSCGACTGGSCGTGTQSCSDGCSTWSQSCSLPSCPSGYVCSSGSCVCSPQATTCGACSVSCGTGTMTCTDGCSSWSTGCSAGNCSTGYECSGGTCVCTIVWCAAKGTYTCQLNC